MQQQNVEALLICCLIQLHEFLKFAAEYSISNILYPPPPPPKKTKLKENSLYANIKNLPDILYVQNTLPFI
jgi:hypothetical protein